MKNLRRHREPWIGRALDSRNIRFFQCVRNFLLFLEISTSNTCKIKWQSSSIKLILKQNLEVNVISRVKNNDVQEEMAWNYFNRKAKHIPVDITIFKEKSMVWDQYLYVIFELINFVFTHKSKLQTHPVSFRFPVYKIWGKFNRFQEKISYQEFHGAILRLKKSRIRNLNSVYHETFIHVSNILFISFLQRYGIQNVSEKRFEKHLP